MDGTRFDNLTRAMASTGSRRRFLAAITGLVGGAAVATADAACPAGQYAASGGRCLCKGTGRPQGPDGCSCPPNQIMCNGVCSTPPCCNAETCPSPGVCLGRTCCQPTTVCAPGQCGPQPNGCGGTLDCGPCCTPRTACNPDECGLVDDGCGDTLDCGECCTPRTTCTSGECGTVNDGCGGDLTCQPCCIPRTECNPGECGQVANGCDGWLDCPACCVPRTICNTGECGEVDDGCGDTIDCGACCQTTCNSGDCGLIDDGCSGTLNCGSCCPENCVGRTCGDDGCGGTCGTCPNCSECDGGGFCTQINCPVNLECFYRGTCDPATGLCSAPFPVEEGSGCSEGICCGGACVAEDTCPVCGNDADCAGIARDNGCQAAICRSGLCVLQTINEGVACPSDACHGFSTCQLGECIGEETYCGDLDDECNTGICDLRTGECVKVAINQGEACFGPTPCRRGVCNRGVCVTSPAFEGEFCNDSGPCTTGTCRGGACVGSTQIDCSFMTTDCVTGVCDPTNNSCIPHVKTERIGLPCDDGLTCTFDTVCQSNGACRGGGRLTCDSPPTCYQHPATCVTGSGGALTCAYTPAEAGVPCGGTNRCNGAGFCQACIPRNGRVCPAAPGLCCSASCLPDPANPGCCICIN